MATSVCPICGEPTDAEDDMDPHSHFRTDDVPCTICGDLPEDHPFLGQGADHEYESGI
jgi:hypothetical protein